jgi:thermitase
MALFRSPAPTASLSSEVKSPKGISDVTKEVRKAVSASYVANELLVQTRAGIGKEKFDEELSGFGATSAEEIT